MDIDQDGCIDTTEDDDDDNDGVLDSEDDCKYTQNGLEVDDKGCSGIQLDDDNDGVHNLDDLCPNTPVGERVSSTGCTIEVENNVENNVKSEDSSTLIWVLFSLTGIIILAALYINFKPEPDASPKQYNTSQSTVNDSGSEGEGSIASTDVIEATLNDNGGDAQLATDES